MKQGTLHWNRIVAEAIAIVGSILLAFAIDAWWDEHETDQWQVSELVALREEFSEDLAALETVTQTHARNASDLESLLLKLEQPDPNGLVVAPDSLLAPLVAWRTSDMPMGTLNGLLASGRLADIRNAEIRQGLASWPSLVGDAQEDEELARDFVVNVVAPRLLGQGVLEAAYRARPLPLAADKPYQSSTSTSIRPTPVLTELATIRIAHSRLAEASLIGLQADLRRIIGLIDMELTAG